MEQRNRSRSPRRNSYDISKFTELWTNLNDLMIHINSNKPKKGKSTNPWNQAYIKMENVMKSNLKIIPEDIQRKLQPPYQIIDSSNVALPADSNITSNDSPNVSNIPPTSTTNVIQDDVSIDDVQMDTVVTKTKLRKSEPKHEVINEKYAVFISNVEECSEKEYIVSHIYDTEMATNILKAADIAATPLFVRRVGIEEINRPRFLVIILDNENAQKKLLNAEFLKNNNMIASLPRSKKSTQKRNENGKSKSNIPSKSHIPQKSNVQLKSNDPSKPYTQRKRKSNDQPNARDSWTKNIDRNSVCVFLKNVPASANDKKFVEELYSKTKITGMPTYTRRVGKPKIGASQYLVVGVENVHQQKQILNSKFLAGKNIQAELPKKKTFFRPQPNPSQQQPKRNGFSNEMEEFKLFKKFMQFRRQ